MRKIESISERVSRRIEVNGPAQTKKFIEGYFRKHPKIATEMMTEAGKYGAVLSKVKNFQFQHPGIEDGTYDAVTGEPVSFDEGFMVTFHQNHSLNDPYSDYSDEDYAIMCVIAKRELKSESVYIGYFGNAEVSFHCGKYRKAKTFAVQHNQNSVWKCAKNSEWSNKRHDRTTNPCESD